MEQKEVRSITFTATSCSDCEFNIGFCCWAKAMVTDYGYDKKFHPDCPMKKVDPTPTDDLQSVSDLQKALDEAKLWHDHDTTKKADSDYRWEHFATLAMNRINELETMLINFKTKKDFCCEACESNYVQWVQEQKSRITFLEDIIKRAKENSEEKPRHTNIG